MREKILKDLNEILDKIPTGSVDGLPALTEDEVKLELATRIVKSLPIPADLVVPGSLAENRDDLFDRMAEFGVYYSGSLHPELAKE